MHVGAWRCRQKASHGRVDVWQPHQWATDLNPKPYKYFIYEKDPHLRLIGSSATSSRAHLWPTPWPACCAVDAMICTTDALDDYTYVGDVAFCAVNVPGKVGQAMGTVGFFTGADPCCVGTRCVRACVCVCVFVFVCVS